MSHAHSHENTVPKQAVIGALTVVAFSLALTTLVSFGFLDRAAVPVVERAKANAAPVTTRELRFADRADGAVLIIDATSDETIAVIEQETQSGGFVRGVMRGLARERRMHGIGPEPHFVLTQWNDGALSLTDTATDRVIELGAFGSDNRAVFQALLPGREAS